jgi:hypothetical protein
MSNIKIIDQRPSKRDGWITVRLSEQIETLGSGNVFSPQKRDRKCQASMPAESLSLFVDRLSKTDARIKAIYSFEPHWLAGQGGSATDQEPSRVKNADGSLGAMCIGNITGRPVFIKHELDWDGYEDNREKLNGEGVTIKGSKSDPTRGLAAPLPQVEQEHEEE